MSDQFMQIGLPANLKVTNEFGHLRIARRWFHSRFIPLTFFIIVWDGFLIFLYTMLIRKLVAGDLSVIPMLLYPFFHAIIGIGLTYYILAAYLNSTVIDLDFDSLTIKSGPLPYFGNMNIPARTLRQLYVKEDGYIRSEGGIMTYAVHAILNDQKSIKLVGGFYNQQQAMYIEQELEKVLHIEDMPVKGEIR